MENKVVKIRVPASSANLGPGFDSLGVALNLYSYLTAEITQYDMLEIIITGSHAGADIPLDKTNTVYEAIEYVHNKLGLPVKGLKLTMELNSPIARGLGSSATAIAAGVYIANELLNRPLTLQGMIDIATEIEGHPDNIVPTIVGGFVVSIMEGSKVIYSEAPFPPALKFIAVIPDFELLTSKAKSVVPKELSLSDAVFNLSRSALLTAAFSTNNYNIIKYAIKDKMHQDYRATLIPGMKEVMGVGESMGALGCYLSGAGPTIGAIVHKDLDKVGSSMVKTWAEFGIKAQYKLLELDRQGIVLM
jgi:homoserine kinase